MESALRPLVEHLTCQECQEVLGDRIQNLVAQWSVVKVLPPCFFNIDLADVRYSARYNVLPGHVTQAPSPIQNISNTGQIHPLGFIL